jgi:hypothetical protein
MVTTLLSLNIFSQVFVEVEVNVVIADDPSSSV